MNLARSGNQKQEKLALDLLDLNMVESLTETETLEPDCFDKISVGLDRNQNKEKTLGNNEKSDMDWTTVRAKNKRNRSGSNDTEQINIATQMSHQTKSVKSEKKSNPQNENKETGKGNKGQNQSKLRSETKKNGNDKPAVNKDSVLVVVTETHLKPNQHFSLGNFISVRKDRTERRKRV